MARTLLAAFFNIPINFVIDETHTTLYRARLARRPFFYMAEYLYAGENASVYS